MAQLRLDHDQFVRRGAQIIVIGAEGAAAFARYWEENRLPFLGLPDPNHSVLKLYGQQVNLFRLGRMPAQVVVDRAGHRPLHPLRARAWRTSRRTRRSSRSWIRWNPPDAGSPDREGDADTSQGHGVTGCVSDRLSGTASCIRRPGTLRLAVDDAGRRSAATCRAPRPNSGNLAPHDARRWGVAIRDTLRRSAGESAPPGRRFNLHGACSRSL